MARQGLWNIAKKRMLEDRGALPKEEGDFIRKYKVMHEENFLSCWLRDDIEGKAEEVEERDRKDEEEDEKTAPPGPRVKFSLFCLGLPIQFVVCRRPFLSRKSAGQWP